MSLRSTFGLFGVVSLVGVALGAQACSDDPATAPTGTSTSSSSSSSSSSGSSGTSGQSSGGEPDSGGPDGGGDGTPKPIEAEANKWTWVPFADSSCANGSPTGIGINKGTSKDLVIYMEGGGACWNETTCGIGALATNLDGFDETKFKTQLEKLPGSHLDRATEGNPFKDASLVYIPYCTGDVHSGDKDAPYGQKHHGRKNIEAYLKRLVPTFKDSTHVTLTGSSAGGFGAAINYGRFADAFGKIRVDLVDDSGPPFPLAQMPHYKDEWLPAWNAAAAFPADCAGCADEPTKLLPYYLKKYQGARFALLSYTQDLTIRSFFTFPSPMASATFETTLQTVVGTTFDDPPATNGRYFLLQGSLHTMLGKVDPPGDAGASASPVTGAGGVTLAQFLTAMYTDDANWKSVKVPAP